MGIQLLEKQAEEVAQHNTHLKKLFTNKLQDFCTMREDSIHMLQEVNAHFELCHNKGVHKEMKDPAAQYLAQCSPIGSPRGIQKKVAMNLKIDPNAERLRQ